MNAADLARLELAKRAYRHVEPSAIEVQRGVRKARLGLRRPRQRRAWFSKTLVAVVLAMGGLAFAKPQALGVWVETALRSGASSSPKRAGGAGVSAEAALAPRLVAGGAATPVSPKERSTETPTVESRALTAPLAPAAASQPAPADQQPAKRAAGSPQGPKSNPAQVPNLAQPDPARKLDPESAAVVADNAQPEGSEAGVASEWGRVGEALARGDEPRAMAALKELSHSEDPRTRDKADLGRAQLLMGNGNRDQACTMARSLTNRRAGGRIERQAQVLLKSCTPNNR